MTFPRHNSFLACWLWFMATGHLGAPTEALRGGGSSNVSTREKCGLQSQKGNLKNTTRAEDADLPRGEALPRILREEGSEGLIRTLSPFDLGQ